MAMEALLILILVMFISFFVLILMRMAGVDMNKLVKRKRRTVHHAAKAHDAPKTNG